MTSPVPGGPTQSLILHAYRIVVPEPDSEQTNQDPSVELMGSASIVLYPNESLSSGTMDIRVIYFQSLLISEDSIEGLERPNSASAIGKAILCISLNPVEPGQSVALPKPRLDPVESFKQIPESAFSRQSLAESETLNMESDSNEKKEPEEMGQLKRALNGRHNRGQGDGNEPDIKTILKGQENNVFKYLHVLKF